MFLKDRFNFARKAVGLLGFSSMLSCFSVSSQAKEVELVVCFGAGIFKTLQRVQQTVNFPLN